MCGFVRFSSSGMRCWLRPALATIAVIVPRQLRPRCSHRAGWVCCNHNSRPAAIFHKYFWNSPCCSGDCGPSALASGEGRGDAGGGLHTTEAMFGHSQFAVHASIPGNESETPCSGFM